jgi:hypothetical protein
MAARRSKGQEPRIVLADLGEGAKPPELMVFAVDASGEAIHSARVDADGGFTLSDAVLKKAHEIVVGPPSKDLEEVDRSTLARFRVSFVTDLIERGEALEIPESKWGRFLGHRICVDGSVSHCYPIYSHVSQLLLESARSEVVSFEKGQRLADIATLSTRDLAHISDAIIANPGRIQPIFPLCEVVCHGLVEVYRRTCCCYDLVLEDPRIQDLIDRLQELVVDVPVQKWPPPPPPPPEVEIEQLGVIQGGALSEVRVKALQDVHALRRLEGRDQLEYVVQRPYLRPFWCDCGPAHKVGQGSIQPDGTFHICWNEPSWRPAPWCHDSYAFVVKQNYNDQTITIYDGLAAHRWFGSRTGIHLESHDYRARGCRDNTFPGDGSGAFVVLQDIGSTHSHRLKTPDADGWDSVASPADYNDGLRDPVPTAAAARGNLNNSNWGGTLSLRYHFSEPMRTSPDARYYRISVTRSDASGDPTGPRTYLGAAPGQELSWLWYEVVGTTINVRSQQLGPTTLGGNANLFWIPFDAEHDWQDGQFHGYLDTTRFANDRYLVMLEVFDSAGHQIRPTGRPGPGTEKPFTFRRWYQETGPTAEVPFGALTHMLWWDNRPSQAHIIDLRHDDIASSDQCQFLVGPRDTRFSSGYRAYHEDAMFILNHRMWWRRGLGGPSGVLIDSPENAGQPPGPLAVTPTTVSPPSPTFGDMLDSQTKCSFSLNLHVNVKTTNGSGRLTNLDADDQAAFALERTGP